MAALLSLRGGSVLYRCEPASTTEAMVSAGAVLLVKQNTRAALQISDDGVRWKRARSW
jgi:hypothetical protein